MVRVAPAGVRVLRAAAAFAAVLLAACASNPGGGSEPDRSPAPALAPFETYVLSPTEIRAREVTVLLPSMWADDLTVTGLSPGWTERNGKRVFLATGDCRLVLHELEIRAEKLSVTLVPPPAEPEFLLTAEGDVVLAHVSKRIGNLSRGLQFLMIRNDQRLER